MSERSTVSSGQGRAVWQDALHAWVLTGLDECTFVCSREDLFATEHSDFADGPVIRGRRSVALLDGEDHRRVHALLSSFLAPSRVAAMRGGVIRPVIVRQVDALAGGDGAAELAEDFADRIPGRIIAGLLGLPMDDEELIRRYDRWSLALTPWVQTRGEDEIARAAAASAAREMTAALRPFVLERRTHPRDDLVSLLWRVGPSLLAGWSEEDVLDQCRILFLAGGEGVAQLVCTVLYLVLTVGSLRRAVDRDRASLPRLVEEALRRYPPAQLRPRRATQEVELDGAVIRRGDVVYPHVQQANLDPSRFSRPRALDLDRPNPTRHLAFNVGPRHCAGAALSRAVAFEAVDALLGRLPGIRLRPDADPPALVGFRFKGFRPLHVLLSSGDA